MALELGMMELLTMLYIDPLMKLKKPYVGSCAAANENVEIYAWTDTQKTNTRKFLEAQLDAYDQGRCIWSYRLRDRLGLDLLDGKNREFILLGLSSSY
jgi:hypothetical protein